MNTEPRETPPGRSAPSVVRYLPHVIVVTLFVVVMPVVVVWVLQTRGVVSSPLVLIPLAIVLSLAAWLIASAVWTRRRRAGDLVFSELLLWGWVRRLRSERKLAKTTALLDAAGQRDPDDDDAVGIAKRERLLTRLAGAVDAQDAYTVGHSHRVARHAATVARRMGLSEDEVDRIWVAATVHDVGKLRLPREILEKPGKLTDAEYEIVKSHAEEGAAIVAVLGDEQVTAIVRHHHERMDGAGYPAGLAGEQIPLGARIVAVADTFDAIIEARPYRAGAPHKQALDVLRQEAGKQFDPHVVEVFLNRYAGLRGLGIPAALAALVGRALAWARGRSATPRRTAAAVSALAAIATTALASSSALKHEPAVHHVATPIEATLAPPQPAPHRKRVAHHRRPRVEPRPVPAPKPASTPYSPPARAAVAPKPAAQPVPPAVKPRLAPVPNSTCQAYNIPSC